MSTTSRQLQEEQAPVVSRKKPRRRWRRLIIVVVLVLVAGVTVVVVTMRIGFTTDAGVNPATSNASVATATVEQRTLIAQTRVNGTLGFATKFEVFNKADGTLTGIPSPGQQIAHGNELYRVDGKPVYLLRGSVPVYRELSRSMKGDDVRQLNTELVALGYADKRVLDPNSNTFSAQTYAALRKLQKKFGLTQTGTLPVGQAVFLPSDTIQVSKVNGSIGGPAQPGVIIEGTSTGRIVTVALEPSKAIAIRVDDEVTVTLPNLKSTPGKVTAIGAIATKNDSGSSTVDVSVMLLKPEETGQLDQAPVQVAITSASEPNALAVPVSALLAQAGGGYALEVIEDNDVRKLYPVTLGLFDDSAGMVQVKGQGVRAGQRIVVPAP
jgi:peptidoglycan hydrolase-like protein with peptidoglycan-binding domain